MITAQNYDTFNWYLKGIQDHNKVVLDSSELPDKVQDVKFWQYRCRTLNDVLEEGYYAIGKVQVMNDFE
jgi:hypothetical protein